MRLTSGMRATYGSDDPALTKPAIQQAINDGNLATLVSPNYLLPAYPVGFIVAKDITIRLKQNSNQQFLEKSMEESQSSSGGGFLCFSTSNASANSKIAESSYYGSQADYFYIRIPGPQIIGWFQQLTPADKAIPYRPIDPIERTAIVDRILASLPSSKPRAVG